MFKDVTLMMSLQWNKKKSFRQKFVSSSKWEPHSFLFPSPPVLQPLCTILCTWLFSGGNTVWKMDLTIETARNYLSSLTNCLTMVRVISISSIKTTKIYKFITVSINLSITTIYSCHRSESKNLTLCMNIWVITMSWLLRYEW